MKTFISLSMNERGSVINIALIVLLLLTVLGLAATYSTNTELKIASNYKSDTVAFYASEGALEEARARLRGSKDTANFAGDPSSPPNPLWTAYIYTETSPWEPADEPNYSSIYQNNIPTTSDPLSKTLASNSLSTGMSYLVKIRHKKEYDAEVAGHALLTSHYFDNDGFTGSHTAASQGNIIYYGYGDPLNPMTIGQFTTAAPTEYKPVEIVTSYGFKGKSVKMVEIEVVKNPGPKVIAAVYAKDDVTGNGSALSVDGTDNCGVAAPKPPIYTKDPATTTLHGSQSTLGGQPANPVTGTDDIDIAGYVDSMKGGATTILTSDQSGAVFGSLNNFVTVYSDTSNPYNVQGLKLTGVEGYGVLLVKGDLFLNGRFDWNGLILVTGTITFSGGGNEAKNITGAVLAKETVTVNGNIDILYDSCVVDSAMNTQAPTVIGWKEVH